MKQVVSVFVFFIFIFQSVLNASVKASVNSHTLTNGEYVVLDLDVAGKDIKKPQLYNLCGVPILSSGSQTNIQVINGEYQKKYILSYKFMPKKSCTIEPIAIQIDSKVEYTKPIKIEVKPYKASKNDDFLLLFSSNKKDVFVGEPFVVTLLLKQRKDAQALDSKFQAPKFQGFWVKNETKPKRYEDDNYIITKVQYTMAPQRAGLQKIAPAQLQIATRANTQNNWGMWMDSVKWRSYFSNEIEMNVKSLPQNISLVGDFILSIEANKKVVNANEAVNVTLTLQGEGNLEDVTSFKPTITGVSVFDEKINITHGVLTQKLAFVGDSDFTIPAFEVKYFDLKTKSVKLLKTKEIAIHVNTPKVEKLVIKKAKNEENEKAVTKKVIVQQGISSLYAIFIFIAGIFVGVLLFSLKDKRLFQREKKVSIKDPKTLLIKLMPYKEDVEVQELINIIEANLYSGTNKKIDKELVKKCIQKYEIL